MGGGTSSPPPGPGTPQRKRGAIALQVKLVCATLDAVKSRYPELRDRRFPLRVKIPLPLDTLVRLDARLHDGSPYFRARAVVERVVGTGGAEPATLTLGIVAMDEAGRELVAWMGGKPPKPLRDPAAASSATPAQTAPPAPAPTQSFAAPPPPAQPATAAPLGWTGPCARDGRAGGGCCSTRRSATATRARWS